MLWHVYLYVPIFGRTKPVIYTDLIINTTHIPPFPQKKIFENFENILSSKRNKNFKY